MGPKRGFEGSGGQLEERFTILDDGWDRLAGRDRADLFGGDFWVMK
jgi:hypothetical protein